MKWFVLFLLMMGAILCATGIDIARSQEQAEKPGSELTGQEGKNTIPFTITDPALSVQDTEAAKPEEKTAPLNEKAEQPRKGVKEGALDEKQEAEIEDLKSRFRKLVEEEELDLRYYNVIYDLIDDVKQALVGMLPPEMREEIVGIAEVRDVFKSPKFGLVAGCMVTEGTVYRSKPIRVLRDNVVIYEGELESLRRFKDDVSEVKKGMECGIGVKNYTDVKEGDQIEVFEVKEFARTL